MRTTTPWGWASRTDGSSDDDSDAEDDGNIVPRSSTGTPYGFDLRSGTPYGFGPENGRTTPPARTGAGDLVHVGEDPYDSDTSEEAGEMDVWTSHPADGRTPVLQKPEIAGTTPMFKVRRSLAPPGVRTMPA